MRERNSSLLCGRPQALTFPFMSLFRYSSAFNSGEYVGSGTSSILSLCSASHRRTASVSWAFSRSAIR